MSPEMMKLIEAVFPWVVLPAVTVEVVGAAAIITRILLWVFWERKP